MYIWLAPSTSAQLTATDKKVGVAERHIGYRNIVPSPMACDSGTPMLRVGQRRTANRGERFVPHQQPVPNSQAIADGEKRPPLALFGTLSVADMDGGRVVIARRQRGADAGVHPATQENNRALCVFHHAVRCHFEPNAPSS